MVIRIVHPLPLPQTHILQIPINYHPTTTTNTPGMTLVSEQSHPRRHEQTQALQMALPTDAQEADPLDDFFRNLGDEILSLQKLVLAVRYNIIHSFKSL